MTKIKNWMIEIFYQYVYMDITLLGIIWGVGILLLFGVYMRNNTYIRLEKFLSQTNFDYVTGRLLKTEWNNSGGGRGQSSPYIKIVFEDGKEFYHMPSLEYEYDWDELFSNLKQGDYIQLYTYNYKNDSREPKFVSITVDGQEILSLEDTKNICATRLKENKGKLIYMFIFGILSCFIALGSTIMRR